MGDENEQQQGEQQEQQPTIEARLDKLEAELTTLKSAPAATDPKLTALLEKHGIRAAAEEPAAT